MVPKVQLTANGVSPEKVSAKVGARPAVGIEMATNVARRKSLSITGECSMNLKKTRAAITANGITISFSKET